MYLPIISVVATFLNDGGLSLATVCEQFLCRENVVDNHSLTTSSLTVLRESGTAKPIESLKSSQ